MTGLGQGAAFSLALVLLVRYTRTPEASGRLTGMAFLISYGIASIGPVAMGLVRDVTGGLSLVWAVLAAIGVLQAVVVVRLRPRPPPGRLSRTAPSPAGLVMQLRRTIRVKRRTTEDKPVQNARRRADCKETDDAASPLPGDRA